MRTLLFLAMGFVTANAQNFSRPFPPHKVIGNIYYVGSRDLATYLITTPQGHILINSDFEYTVPLIQKNVAELGFKFSDVKILLGSHAHDDHMQGDAQVKELTGARVMAMDLDVPELKRITPGGKQHPIDRVLHDGDKVKLGGVTLTAHLTPGHTEGCTTWTMKVQEGGKSYDAVIIGGVAVNEGYVLVNNTEYPRIVEDYVATFKKLRALPCDVFLGAHPDFYDMETKYAKLGKRKNGDPNPFIDHAGYLAYIDEKEADMKAELEEQQSRAAAGKAVTQ